MGTMLASEGDYENFYDKYRENIFHMKKHYELFWVAL